MKDFVRDDKGNPECLHQRTWQDTRIMMKQGAWILKQELTLPGLGLQK